MKVIIQIPCLNEAETLPQVINDLPNQIAGVDELEYLIIDDGSTDGTCDVARELGVHHIIRLERNTGLANAFSVGLESALKRGADIIVNTDGDNQYCGEDIQKIVKPIVESQADMVIGCRPIMNISEFSILKKFLQRLGSGVVKVLSGAKIPDATSGFRAYSKEAALKFFLTNNFTYTLESLIQFGRDPMVRVSSVPIRVNKKTRESRLFKSISSYVSKSMLIILRSFLFYNPFKFFFLASIPFWSLSFLLGIRYLLNTYVFDVVGRTYIPSLILLAISAVTAVALVVIGVLGELNVINRKMNSEILYRYKKREYLSIEHGKN